MVARGWTERLPPNRALVGKTFAKDGVTALLYQDSDSEKHGVAHIYGQCNNMNNHRADSTAWVDITDQLH
jgi:hypothetical protein